MMKRYSACFLAAMVFGFGAITASAQTSTIVQTPPGVEVRPGHIILPPGMELPPGVRLPNRPGPPDGTNTVAKTQSPEEKRLQELLKLKFNRTPDSILKGLAGQYDATSATTKEVEQFQQSVVMGDWKAVGKYLAELPEDHGKQVYRYLLRELPNSSREPGPQRGNAPPEVMMEDGVPVVMNQGQPGPGQNPGLTLVVEDVITLAEIAPHELTEGDAKLLGQLLRTLLSRGDALKPLLTQLDVGVKRLGGNDPEDRKRAAELLLGANCLSEAVKFFPPLETAIEQKDWRVLEQYARDYAARGKREKDDKLLQQALDINQFIVGLTNVEATNRDPALKRCMELLPQISQQEGTNWLRDRFRGDPAEGLMVLAVANELVQRGFSNRNLDTRTGNLALQKQMVDTLLDVNDASQAQWQAALNLTAQGWMQEANWAKQRYRPPRNYGAQYDQFGNMIGYENYPPDYYNNGNQVPPLSPDQVLEVAPDEDWLQHLDPSLRFAVMNLMADLYSKTDTPDKALTYIEAVAKVQPETGTKLANAFLRSWAEARNPNRNQMNQSRYYVNRVMYYGSPNGQMRQGISLTRAMQVRNIKELAGLMRRFELLNLPKLDDDAVVGAFAAAHSPAEVFKVGDIESVFGPQEKLKPDTLAGLAQSMRERLAQQWRQPRVQQDAKTERNDKQIEVEVLRGYDVVLDLVNEALQQEDSNWRLHVARACTCFDLAEFQYGKKVDLAIYVEKREECFQEFELAARLYAKSLSDLDLKEETPFVYQQWFNVNLGASDLAYVTRQQEPETNQLARIRTAIQSLPGGAAERHMATFARQLGQSANQLRPELKPRYLRAGLEIVGDQPEADEARKLVAYYDDLLQELELVVRLDGDATVGHSQPFGVFVSLRHTADIEREASGFGRYLRNNKTGNPYYGNPYGGQQRNFTEEFEKQVRQKLADHYEVKTVTFLDEKVKSRGYGREGWRETPLGYLLLQAKDGSVDQLPSFNMDLDFSDSRGMVVLSVKSPVVLLDARPEQVPARPLEKLEIVQTLDAREIVAGQVALEIKATANGLVPPLNDLLRTNFAHLEVADFSDRGVAINQIDTEADNLAPVSERNWLIKFNVAMNAPSSLEFKFPEPILANAHVTHKRYADADLVEVPSTLALAGVSLRPRPWWHWAIGGGALAGLLAGCGWSLREKVHPQTVESAAYSLPAQITPFAVIQLLRRMQADSALRLPETQRDDLNRTLRELETHYFAKRKNGAADLDLAGIGREWVSRVENGK